MHDSTFKSHKCGPQALSPNGVDKLLAHEDQLRYAAHRRAPSSRGHTHWLKREADRLRQARRKRLRHLRLPALLGEIVRWRLQAVRYYTHWREHGSEAAAAQRCATKHQISVHTVRRWARLYRQAGIAALLPKPPGPVSAAQRISWQTAQLVVALRRLLGWNEKRLAAELAQRGLAHIGHTSVGRIFRRYHLATRTYHSLAQCDGIPKRRYEKVMPNQQWHMDFAETTLTDGRRVNWVVLLDDHSRFCLCCRTVADLTAATALAVVEDACHTFGRPQEVVTDNGRAFASLYVGVPTQFGIGLRHYGIRHRRSTLYYPEGNGKAEALVKIVKHEGLRQALATPAELEAALAAFSAYYNYYRLHGSLAWQGPGHTLWRLSDAHPPRPARHPRPPAVAGRCLSGSTAAATRGDGLGRDQAPQRLGTAISLTLFGC
jgi:transposase InsO family protein